jgi:hypothetical protein
LVCRNPLLAEERWRKRADLLRVTEAALTKLADKTAGGAQGKAKITRAIGRIENRYKLAKHFDIAVTRRRLQLSPQPSPHQSGGARP